MEELKPCPFCGEIPIFIINDTVLHDYKKVSPDEQVWDISCETDECWMGSGADWLLTQKLATKWWNKRVKPQEGKTYIRENFKLDEDEY